MKYGHWMTAKDVLRVNAMKWPGKTGIKDLHKAYTFEEWNERACRLANGLASMGLRPGDRFAVLAYNCVEWMELYAAAAKGGFVCVPIMFRLAGPEMGYILRHSEARVLVVQGGLAPDGQELPWIDRARALKLELPGLKTLISFGVDEGRYEGFLPYEEVVAGADPGEPDVRVDADDLWVLMYTGGTTGRPKGVMKSHANLLSQYFITIYEQSFDFDDTNLLVMPCCHINSLFYSFVATWVGGTVMAYNAVSFDPEDLLRTFSGHGVTFTSLVPTQYVMLLALPEEVKARYDVSCVTKLLCSSAPARRDTKLGIMEMFPNARLWEAYGSTEAGMVTILKPDEQMTKLGSIGREVIGSDRIRLYDGAGELIDQPGVVGELFSRSPQVFEGYWNEPEKTAEAMRGEYFSAGDMARRDEDGYYTLVDRKANMIITGGENVYPAEVENAVGSHPKVKHVAVIGTPHEKWGEQVTAVVVLHEGMEAAPEEISSHCRGEIAGYKVPKKVVFIEEGAMPMSGPGKILHRVLRERYGR